MTHYRELGKIASGGAATVFLAVDEDGQRVAIKRPHPHLFEDASALAAFRREIALGSHLRHPNIVTVYEANDAGGGAFDVPELVLELVDGLPLGDLLATWNDDRMDPSRAHGAALRIAHDVASGLAAVHELRGETGEPLGLVHRDVSPHNVLVGVDGIAKLADFGLARSLARGDRSTTGGVLKGKAGYLAPEYIRGAPIDARVDIFALGVVLWESLTRERLFSAENEAATLQRILTTAPPTLASKGVDLGPASADVQMIIERATARSPSARYATVREMADELALLIATHALRADHAAVAASFGPSARAKIAARTPVDTVPASVVPRTSSTERWRRGASIVAALAIVAALVGIGAQQLLHRPRSPSVDIRGTAPLPTVTPMTPPNLTLDVPTIPLSSLPAVSSSAPPAPTASAHASPPPHDPKRPRPNPY